MSIFRIQKDQTLRLSGRKLAKISSSTRLDPARLQDIESWQTTFFDLVSMCDRNEPLTLQQLYGCYQQQVNQAFLKKDIPHLDLLSGVISVMRHLLIPSPKKPSDTDPVGHILSDLCASYFLEKSTEDPNRLTHAILSRLFYEKAQAIWHMITNYRGYIKPFGPAHFAYTLHTETSESYESDRVLWYILKGKTCMQSYTQPLNFEDLTAQILLYLSTSITLTPNDVRSRFRLMEMLFGAPFAVKKKNKLPLYLNYYLKGTPLLELLTHEPLMIPNTQTLENLTRLYQSCTEYAYITACVRSTVSHNVAFIIKDQAVNPLATDPAPQNDAYHP